MPLPKRIILGIDPGLATTGWGAIETEGRTVILKGYGVLLTPSSDSLPVRLQSIHLQLSELLRRFQPSVVAIEELFFTKFAVSIASTAQARGVILFTVAQEGIPLAEYNPRAVKMALTGFGSASKIQMQTMLMRSFGLKEIPKPDDAADAVSMALCHVQTNSDLKVHSDRRSRAAFESELLARSEGRK